MKLLIVDDEELTRTGLITSIDWKSCGIEEILQADDGIHGLELARMHRPEIILCDVRMPRMDGITMLKRLEAEFPDTVPIFMSGYSDKDYLKAAIKLKAVRYIEKPLDPDEIIEAIHDAKAFYYQKQHSRRGETLHSMENASRLALQLTVPSGTNHALIDDLCHALELSSGNSLYFTAFIVKLDSSSDFLIRPREELIHQFEAYIKTMRLQCIHAEKKTQYQVYFVYHTKVSSEHTLLGLGNYLLQLYKIYGKCSVSIGETYQGIFHAYHSYTSAVILLQSSFFYPSYTVLLPSLSETSSANTLPLPADAEETFLDLLKSRKKEKLEQLLAQFSTHFTRNTSLFPNQVKDFYYRLFLSLENAQKQAMIVINDKESIADTMDRCFNFQELHETLCQKVRQFLQNPDASAEENPTIYLIKEYISNHYASPSLSVKDICDHIHLSASYVCTYFKKETGSTLNQYLTEYRMERARQLLSDPRYKISEISSRVGYSDGNYFGKSFKKHSGLSPSEYREKILS